MGAKRKDFFFSGSVNLCENAEMTGMKMRIRSRLSDVNQPIISKENSLEWTAVLVTCLYALNDQ